MPLINQVHQICSRLAPLGWRDLLLAASDDVLDIAQSTPAKLAAALAKPIAKLNDPLPGFEDFHPEGGKGIFPRVPARSLLYHALASPRVVRDAAGRLLQAFPTLAELELVEDLIFAIEPVTLAKVVAGAGDGPLSVVVFATEYRPAPDVAGGPGAGGGHADMAFSRTGLCRVGTARPKYRPEARGFWPEDEDNPNGFRVVPTRFTVWLAAPMKGDKAVVLRDGPPDVAERARTFWTPVHKLFDGDECLQGLTLAIEAEARYFNMKLQRVRKSLKSTDAPTDFPYVITDGLLATLDERSDLGRLAVVPVVQERLVRPAIVGGKALTYRVPPRPARDAFATYTTDAPTRTHLGRQVEVHRFPAYVHARLKVEPGGGTTDLNDEEDVAAAVSKGNYEAQMYVDFTGEGWVAVTVPALAGQAGVAAVARPAYTLLCAPDFFPSAGQNEVMRWSRSNAVPGSFRGQIFGVEPHPLNEIRLPANLQLPNSPFDRTDDTITAVVGFAGASTLPSRTDLPDAPRTSTLPDDGAGVFAPGWDVSTDVLGPVQTGTLHLAAYGLGSPFPEDAKLCAALSTFWPAVSPDVYRTLSVHTGNPELRGTVAPLTDEEIGQVGMLPWDGIPGPHIVREADGQAAVEMASFLHADYVTNVAENRFSGRLLARVGADEYERRLLAAARTHWVLSGGRDVRSTRTRWLLLSFRAVAAGDQELQDAQQEAGHVLTGQAYRVEACFLGTADDPTVPSPTRGPRFRRIPLRQHNVLYVSAGNPLALRRRTGIDARFGRAPAE